LNISERDGLGLITQGELIKIGPAKVPRLIGKRGSMIKMIESDTKCKLSIGQNGFILVTGPNDGVLKAFQAIKLVEVEAHSVTLTNDVQELLKNK
jgi:exosome complex component RRP4